MLGQRSLISADFAAHEAVGPAVTGTCRSARARRFGSTGQYGEVARNARSGEALPIGTAHITPTLKRSYRTYSWRSALRMGRGRGRRGRRRRRPSLRDPLQTPKSCDQPEGVRARASLLRMSATATDVSVDRLASVRRDARRRGEMMPISAVSGTGLRRRAARRAGRRSNTPEAERPRGVRACVQEMVAQAARSATRH